jgi:hypothetical protein
VSLESDLDAWLPDPQVRTRHRRSARADADGLWHAAESVRVCDTPRLGRVVRWRIPGTAPELPFGELFRAYPFTVLAEGERSLVSGLCGRLWTLERDYPRISSADEFLAWDEPGTARVLFANWATPNGSGGATLFSEARVAPVDRRARVRMRAVWTVVGRFERLIGGEALSVAARRAEGGG